MRTKLKMVLVIVAEMSYNFSEVSRTGLTSVAEIAVNILGSCLAHLSLTLLHSERPNLYAILAFLSAVGFKCL